MKISRDSEGVVGATSAWVHQNCVRNELGRPYGDHTAPYGGILPNRCPKEAFQITVFKCSPSVLSKNPATSVAEHEEGEVCGAVIDNVECRPVIDCKPVAAIGLLDP